MDCKTEDRREGNRYSLELKLRYRVMQGLRTVWRGAGYTTDLSRTTIRFAVSRPLPLESRVQLVIDWPVRFAEMYPMELCVAGTIVESDEHEATVRMTSWQFRIAPGARSFEMARAQGWAPRGRVREDIDMPAASAAVM